MSAQYFPLKGFAPIDLEAVRMRSGAWCVRPKGALGTCGWSPRPWCAVAVRAPSAMLAIIRALRPL